MSTKSRVAKLEQQHTEEVKRENAKPHYSDAEHNRAMETLAQAMREAIAGKIGTAGEYATDQPITLSPLALEITQRLDRIAEARSHES